MFLHEQHKPCHIWSSICLPFQSTWDHLWFLVGLYVAQSGFFLCFNVCMVVYHLLLSWCCCLFYLYGFECVLVAIASFWVFINIINPYYIFVKMLWVFSLCKLYYFVLALPHLLIQRNSFVAFRNCKKSICKREQKIEDHWSEQMNGFTLVIFRALYSLLFGVSQGSVLKAVPWPIMVYFINCYLDGELSHWHSYHIFLYLNI